MIPDNDNAAPMAVGSGAGIPKAVTAEGYRNATHIGSQADTDILPFERLGSAVARVLAKAGRATR